MSIDVSHDGYCLATGSSDRTIQLWDLKMESVVQTLTDHNDQVWLVVF